MMVKEAGFEEIVERINRLEEMVNKLAIVQRRLLDECVLLKSRLGSEDRELRRLEHVVLMILEELKTMNIDVKKVGGMISGAGGLVKSGMEMR